MYLADYHMHSRISVDAKYPMTEMAEAALRAGMGKLHRAVILTNSRSYSVNKVKSPSGTCTPAGGGDTG